MPWPVFIEEEAGKLNYAALFFFFATPPRHVELHWPGMEFVALGVEAHCLNHWTTRDIPQLCLGEQLSLWSGHCKVFFVASSGASPSTCGARITSALAPFPKYTKVVLPQAAAHILSALLECLPSDPYVTGSFISFKTWLK